MSKKPIIGLTATRYFVQDRNLAGISKVFVNEDYARAIAAAEGVPVILPPVIKEEMIEEYVNMCDGFVITGGRDVHPITYNALPNPLGVDFDLDVDESHIKLIQLAMEKDKPILGICRGCQLINVSLGGTLYQDINTEAEFKTHGHLYHHIKDDVIHPVSVEKNSLLYKMFGTETIKVNSVHHQAIKEIGENIDVCSTAYDGIIECITVRNRKYILGVQWHPEMMFEKYENMLVFFTELINKCK